MDVLKPTHLLARYGEDSLLRTLAERLASTPPALIHLKGLVGSLDAVVAASLIGLRPVAYLFVLHDREEAAYFQNDLQQLLPQREVLLFPTSYRRPYQFEEIENANVLQRAEVLNRLSERRPGGELIVTYPEALPEKVINRRSLVENSIGVRVGDLLDIATVTELLLSYDFEKTDFVYEPGQFAVRGGILDIFSFAGELPFRLELFGDEVERIRTFNPETQLSDEERPQISIVPNVQTRLLEAQRESFFDFIEPQTLVWFKDHEQLLDVCRLHYEKADKAFAAIVKDQAVPTIVGRPETLFSTPDEIRAQLDRFVQVAFGNRFAGQPNHVFTVESAPQPSFNKDFELLAEDLRQHQGHDYTCLIAAEMPRQFERLETIFEEIDRGLQFVPFPTPLRQGFVDHQHKLVCYTDHQIFDRYYKYKSQQKYSKTKALTLKEIQTLQPGDYVTHVDYGIGRFAGLEKVMINDRQQEAIRLIYRDDDSLLISVTALHKISKYAGKEGTPPAISKLGSNEWEQKKKKVSRKVKDIAKELIQLYAKRKAAPGFSFPADDFMQAELESSFMYEDTPDQAKATQDVKDDMAHPYPMDRLVCGDVGFGKTEVAIRAAFKAVASGKQVAMLVPTTILAMQHHKTFSERLEKFPVRIDYVNRFKSAAQIRDTLRAVEAGEVHILIGTHRLVSKDVKFKNLGLMIIDEEQKFGVKTKEKLKEMRVNVDSLTLTATPIPRTLHFSLMGARDLSVIATPPPNRQPVTTELHVFSEVFLRDAVSYELKRGGQVFFVHNRVNDIESIANLVLRMVPDARVTVAHGQMEGAKLEKVMAGFIEGQFDVLVSTNIIESGLDIPNANTIIINQAHMFGLSDLHQMRGRVGRSNRKAFCYLLTSPVASLTSDARKRLQTLEEFSDLGDGFRVAMRDLDIRGAGNLLGGEQSGFITDLGFDMYHKILDEAVQDLKESEFKELFEGTTPTRKLVSDCVIETDLEMLIPETYVANISERLDLYTRLDDIDEETALQRFIVEMRDRFGPLPESVERLVDTVRLRWKAEKAGFEKIILKDNVLKGYFVSSEKEAYFQSAIFGQILQYVQRNSRRCRLKDHKQRLILTVQGIPDIGAAHALLENLTAQVTSVTT